MSLQRRFPKKNLDTSPILRRKYFLFYKYNGQIFKSLDFLETLPNIVGSYKFSMIRAISSASCQQCDGKKNNWIKTHIYNSSLPVCACYLLPWARWWWQSVRGSSLSPSAQNIRQLYHWATWVIFQSWSAKGKKSFISSYNILLVITRNGEESICKKAKLYSIYSIIIYIIIIIIIYNCLFIAKQIKFSAHLLRFFKIEKYILKHHMNGFVSIWKT